MVIKVAHDWKAEAEGLEFEGLEERLGYYKQLRDGMMANRRKEALDRIKELMAQNELSPDDLAEPRAETSKKPLNTRGPMKPKYRDPANAENVWTGQGRAPKWMPENKEQWTDFLIEKPE